MKKYKIIIDKIREIFGTNDTIPLHAPVFIGNEKKYIEECINSTFVSSVGKFVDLFEEKVAKYTGVKKAVSCVNGTSALHLALILAGVGENDEVITQPFTFIATVNAISYCKAKPIFIDIDKETLGLSPSALESWLSQNAEIREVKINNSIKIQSYNKKTNRRIAAVVPVHTFGHPCKIDILANICEKYKIELVEDAAESLGSFYYVENTISGQKNFNSVNKWKHTGIFGKIGILSFNGNKIITTGGGGMLLFNDEELAKKAKHLTTQAKISHPWEYKHDYVGFNYRMPNLNAALGLAQLENIELFVHAKRKLANEYKELFSYLDIKFFEEPINAKSNYWLNAIIFKDRKERDIFLEYSNQNGIMTRPAWELINRLEMYKNEQYQNLENAEYFVEKLVNIPSSPKV